MAEGYGRLPPKSLLNLIQRLALRLRHNEEAHHRRKQRTPAEQKVRREATPRQQDRRSERDEEVSHPVAPVREVSGRGARPLRLALRDENFDPDGPGDGEDCDKEVDRDDDDPTARARVAMHRVPGVEPADQEHGEADTEATVNGAVPAAPFVGKEKGGDGDAEDDDCGDAGSEKGSFRGGEAGLCKKKRRVLDGVSGCLYVWMVVLGESNKTYVENAINATELLHAEKEDR